MPVSARPPQAEGASRCQVSEGLARTSGRRSWEANSHSQAWLVAKTAPSQAGGSLSTKEFKQGWVTAGVMGRGLETNWVLRGVQGPSGSQSEPLRGPAQPRLGWGGIRGASSAVLGLPPGVQSHPEPLMAP